MTSEEAIVNVDGISSSESEQSSGEEDGEEIDVGVDEGFDLSEVESGTDGGEEGDQSEAQGAEGGSRKKTKQGHHNELEKKRRETLYESYCRLKKFVTGKRSSSRSAGRDRTLEQASKIVKEQLQQLRHMSDEANELLETFKAQRAEADEEEKKEIDAHIRELMKVSKNNVTFEQPDDEMSDDWTDIDVDDDDEEESISSYDETATESSLNPTPCHSP